jgi:hypothetical protein
MGITRNRRGMPALALPRGKDPMLTLMHSPHSRAPDLHRTLTTEFLVDVERAWKQHGPKVLDDMARDYPHIFAPMVARLIHVHRMELGAPGDFSARMTRAELLDKVGERFGEQGRKMFAAFVMRLDKLSEQQKEQANEGQHAEGRD